MATFSESEITNLAEILETNSDALSDHLDIYAQVITAADKTAVLSRVTAFQAVENDNTSIEPNVRNFGAKINADKKRMLIRSRIAALLHAGHFVPSGGRLVRC